MDLEKAIEILEIDKSYEETYGEETRETVEALNMAIEALEKQVKEKRTKKKVYICSPLRGDYASNIKNARLYSRYAALLGVIPITPHLLYPQFLDDTDTKERELGLRCGLELLKICDELWAFGDKPSEGMTAEIALAKELDIPIRKVEEV